MGFSLRAANRDSIPSHIERVIEMQVPEVFPNVFFKIPADSDSMDIEMLTNGIDGYHEMLSGLSRCLQIKKVLEIQLHELSADRREKLDYIITEYLKMLQERREDLTELVNVMGGRIAFSVAKTNPFVCELN